MRICRASGRPGADRAALAWLEGARVTDGADHFADADRLALREPAVELFQHGLGGGAGDFAPAQAHRIAVDHGLDPEPVLEHGEICVIVAEEIAHEPHVVEIDDERLASAIDRCGGGSLRCRSAPAAQRCLANAGLVRHSAA